MQPKKMGRPTSDPRTIRFELRLTRKEADTLQYCAETLSIPKAQAIAKGIEMLAKKINQSE